MPVLGGRYKKMVVYVTDLRNATLIETIFLKREIATRYEIKASKESKLQYFFYQTTIFFLSMNYTFQKHLAYNTTLHKPYKDLNTKFQTKSK